MKDVQEFLSAFLTPPPGDSPAAVKQKMLHWIEVANHPEQSSSDQSPHAIAALRRNARQNLRRLAERNPAVMQELLKEAGR